MAEVAKRVKEVIWGTRRGRITTIVSVVILVLLLIVGYLIFFYSKSCGDFECFQKQMSSCSKSNYINDKPEATWQYSIQGLSGGKCEIQVKMIQAKQGSLGLQALQGESMNCFYPTGIATYPEQDLTKCHGVLKEDLQQIIINKLYSYVLENIGQIGDSLKKAV